MTSSRCGTSSSTARPRARCALCTRRCGRRRLRGHDDGRRGALPASPAVLALVHADAPRLLRAGRWANCCAAAGSVVGVSPRWSCACPTPSRASARTAARPSTLRADRGASATAPGVDSETSPPWSRASPRADGLARERHAGARAGARDAARTGAAAVAGVSLSPARRRALPHRGCAVVRDGGLGHAPPRLGRRLAADAARPRLMGRHLVPLDRRPRLRPDDRPRRQCRLPAALPCPRGLRTIIPWVDLVWLGAAASTGSWRSGCACSKLTDDAPDRASHFVLFLSISPLAFSAVYAGSPSGAVAGRSAGRAPASSAPPHSQHSGAHAAGRHRLGPRSCGWPGEREGRWRRSPGSRCCPAEGLFLPLVETGDPSQTHAQARG
jgi:hypothetical protein